MIQLSKDQKNLIISELLAQKEKMSVPDEQFAKQYGISASILSRLKSGDVDGLLSASKYINIAFKLNLPLNERKWNIARTDLLTMIEEDVMFCQQNAKARIFIDDCGLGKTVAARYLAKKLNNCFHIECKQGRAKLQFIRLVAETIGVDATGRLEDIKKKIKYTLRLIPNPMMILDDTGYLQEPAYLELIELVDATEGMCGWLQIGDGSLRIKIDRAKEKGKIGYAAMYSRFSSNYSSYTSIEKNEKIKDLKKLIRDVAAANSPKGTDISGVVNKCLKTENGVITGDLRRLESLLILNK